MEKNKETNYRLWLANTIKANLDHCSRLGDVCGSRLDADGVASYLTDIADPPTTYDAKPTAITLFASATESAAAYRLIQIIALYWHRFAIYLFRSVIR